MAGQQEAACAYRFLGQPGGSETAVKVCGSPTSLPLGYEAGGVGGFSLLVSRAIGAMESGDSNHYLSDAISWGSRC